MPKGFDIKSIDLSCNPLGDPSICLLSTTLLQVLLLMMMMLLLLLLLLILQQHVNMLREVKLSNCAMGDEGLQVIVHMVLIISMLLVMVVTACQILPNALLNHSMALAQNILFRTHNTV